MAQSLVGKVLSSWAILPPMLGKLLHQVDLDAHIGEVQGGLHPGNASSNNKNVFTHNSIPPL